MANILFSGSFVNSLPIGGSAGLGRDIKGNIIQKDITCIFCNYIAGDNKYCVILPSESWIDVIITVNGITIDLNGEYDSIINSIIRKARKAFPTWQV